MTRTGDRTLARRHRRVGAAELATFALSLVVAGVILVISLQNAATFRRDVPLLAVSENVQVDLTRAHIGTHQIINNEVSVNAEPAILTQLDDARAACEALLQGGHLPYGTVEPVTDPGQREVTTKLCHDLTTYASLTRNLLGDSEGAGGGTAVQIRIDTLFESLMTQTDLLSQALKLEVAQDESDLTFLGATLASLVLALGLVVAVLSARHRRVVAGQSAQLARFATIVTSSADSIVSVDNDGIVLSWNPGAEALYGYRAEQIMGTGAQVLVHPEDKELFAEIVQAMHAGRGSTTTESRGVRKDGSTVPQSMTLSPILDADVVVGAVVICRDISDQIARELELVTARSEALEASRLKSQFLATMSHEIRTPLNGVLGLNALLMQTPLDETQRQYTEGVENAGGALLSVINDVLDFSKLEAGKVELDVQPFQPRILVDEVAGLLAVSAHAKGLELLVYCDPAVPRGLAGDAGRIRQVLLNLAGNAVKFTAAGEVMITMEVDQQDVETALVRCEVRDTGIGVAEEGRQALFESFSQADASTTRRFGGTGLGLAISQRLVQAMGGEIGMRSEVGQGSTFWFTLPLPLTSTVEEARLDASGDLLPGLRVLVVDDNATNRLILHTQLSAWRMLPSTVDSADAAIRSLQLAVVAGQPFDIAVLDLLMPDRDGLELAAMMSADPALNHTRMIMLTSSGQVDRQTLARAGISEWCMKPVRPSHLYDRLMRLMAPGAALIAPKVLAPETAPPPGSRGRLLVAEDNEINQLVAEGMLAMLGYEVEIVSNGAEALAALDRGDYLAVLMDCHMPVMDGFEATRQIRRLGGARPRIPIIAMTAGAQSEDRDRCLEAGMDDYVSKPITVEALETTLRAWAVERV